jgi:hypothetical protein
MRGWILLIKTCETRAAAMRDAHAMRDGPAIPIPGRLTTSSAAFGHWDRLGILRVDGALLTPYGVHVASHNSCGGLVDFFWRARRARALSARARMFVTSRVLFFPNQQYIYGRSRFEKACRQKISTLFFKLFFQIFSKNLQRLQHAQKRSTPHACDTPRLHNNTELGPGIRPKSPKFTRIISLEGWCVFSRAPRARLPPPLFLLGWEKRGGGAGKTQQQQQQQHPPE